MVTSVNTNINALAAVQALNDISSQLTSTQGAIESGLKVASASDNPAVFTIAQGLRANVDGLQAVSDSLATGVATGARPDRRRNVDLECAKHIAADRDPVRRRKRHGAGRPPSPPSRTRSPTSTPSPAPPPSTA